MHFKLLLLIFINFSISVASAQQSGKVIQINIKKSLNARPVTTLNNGKLAGWTTGIDGGGTGDGYLTMAAAIFNGDKSPNALPNDPLIPATASHPPILLYYKNGNQGNQTFNLSDTGTFNFNVVHKKYSGLYLTLTSAEGPSTLHITLNYADGSETKDLVLPDYYNDITANDSTLSYAVHNLAKWGPKNNMTESNHHNIDVLNIHTNSARVLKSIRIKKDKTGYFVLWAATGVTI